MKKSWRVALMIAVLNILLGSLNGVVAQQEPLAGGYAETGVNDPEVLSAARFAIGAEARKTGARLSLVAIEHAEVQVVAGLNYMMKMKVKVNGQPQQVTAVVYRNLKQKYSLSRWDRSGAPAGNTSISANAPIEELVKALADAYEAKSLESLDAEHLYSGTVKIVIEHSLVDFGNKESVRNRIEVKEFKTFAQAEKWLDSREHDELPAREARPLEGCKRGVCAYDFDGGILHNHLYLQKISYGLRRGHPFLKTIFLLDGD